MKETKDAKKKKKTMMIKGDKEEGGEIAKSRAEGEELSGNLHQLSLLEAMAG